MSVSLSVESGNKIILNGKAIGKNVPLFDALYNNAKVRSEAGKLRAQGQARAGADLIKESGVGKLSYLTKLEFSLAKTLKGQILDFGQAKGIGVQPDFLLDSGETGDVKLQSFQGQGETFEEAFTQALKSGVGDIKLSGGKSFNLGQGEKLFQGVGASGKGQFAEVGKGTVAQLTQLIKQGKNRDQNAIIDIIKRDKALSNNLISKAGILLFPLVLTVDGKRGSAIFQFRMSKDELFNPATMNYGVAPSKGKNAVALSAQIRASVMNRLVKEHAKATEAAFLATFTDQEYIDGVATLALAGVRNRDISTGRFISTIEYEGESPPLKYARGTITAKLPKEQRNLQQRFISKVQLTEIVRKKFIQKMPKGPRRGPPLSDEVLTYRTGRFANSFQIAYLNYKTNTIKYYYDPVYRVHEATSRDPRELIDGTIREVALASFSRAFRVVRI
jgi:hypothetical protein